MRRRASHGIVLYSLKMESREFPTLSRLHLGCGFLKKDAPSEVSGTSTISAHYDSCLVNVGKVHKYSPIGHVDR
jgi:hypothetical protein